MTKIHTLSADTISKIAAGQVVERPASIVKELVENAIDAQATQIVIELTKSGTEKIVVVDDGIGMTKQNLLKSYLRHTTSKISPDSDLTSIKTFGFRGEALFSIVAAADVSIQTKVKTSLQGYKIKLKKASLVQGQPVGMAAGTKVSVSNLFQHLPARKKFLRTNRSEFNHILQVVTRLALAHPQISFLLKHNQKQVIYLPANQSLAERIQMLIKLDPNKDFFQLQYQLPHFSVQGFVSLPHHARKSSRHLHFFVNNRAVESNFLNQTIQQPYQHLIAKGSYPITILNISTPFDFVDININPQKTTIAFIDQTPIKKLLEEAIISVLDLPKSHLYQIDSPNAPELTLHDSKASPHISSILKETTKAWETTETRAKEDVLQVFDTYLIFESNKELIIIDQHAAHERILYEQFLESYTEKKSQPLQLTKPLVLKLSTTEYEVVSNSLAVFKNIGFTLESFGEHSFIVKTIPSLIDKTRAEIVLKEIIDDLVDEKPVTVIDDKTKQTIAYLACRSAIKAGDSLSMEQRKNIVKKLSQTKTPFTCPHGRPISTTFSSSQLEKMFQRR